MSQQFSTNPYSITMPVENPDMFFGREREIFEIVEERMKQASHGISTILIGGRRIGKTSLLLQIRDRVLREPKCGDGTTLIPVYVNLQESGSLDDSVFFKQVLDSLIRRLRQHWGLPVELLDHDLTDSYKAFCSQLHSMLSKCDEHIGSARFVLLVDEAERLLGKPWTGDVVSNLRHLIDSSDLKNAVILVLSGFRELRDDAMAGADSELGNVVYWTYLSVLAESECRDLVSVPLGGRVSTDVVDAVHDLSGGHPFLVQYIMQQIWMPDPSKITLADVSNAVAKFSQQIRVFESWKSKFTETDDKVYELLARSGKPISGREIHQLIEGETVWGQISNSVAFLSYTGVISRQDSTYVAVGRIFKDWFLQRNVRKGDAVKRDKPPSKLDNSRLLTSALVIIVIFAATVAVLVWAAKQVPPVALAFVLVIAVVFDLVSIVSVLVLNDVVKPDQAMSFLNAVLSKVPMLKLSLNPGDEALLEGNQNSESEQVKAVEKSD